MEVNTKNSGALADPYPVNGIDVSYWQKVINWEKAKSQVISFAFIRASHGASYVDPYLMINLDETARLAIPRGLYHYLKPLENIAQQAQLFARLVNASTTELYCTLDLEENGGLKPAEYEARIHSFVQVFQNQSTKPIMIYTRASFFNTSVPLTNWAWKLPLWIANWTSSNQPLLPREWSSHGQSWLFWQYSANGNGLGAQYGVATKNVDLDRFNGNPQEFSQKFNLDATQPPPPVPVPSTELQMEVMEPALNIRTGPGIKFPVIGTLKQGDVVSVIDLDGYEVWVKIKEGQWVAARYNGQDLLKTI